MAADKRKIARLEEELEESEGKCKKLDRQLKNAQKELEELKAAGSEQSSKADRAKFEAEKAAELADAKSSAREIATLKEQIASLKSQLSDQRGRTAESQRENRESEYDEVEKQSEVRAAEAVQDQLREEIAKLKSSHELAIKEIKDDHERQMREIRRMRKGLAAGRGIGKTGDGSTAGALEALTGKTVGGGAVDAEMKRELQSLRAKLDTAQKEVVAGERKVVQVRTELSEKLEEQKTLRERADARRERMEADVLAYSKQIDATLREKATLEKDKNLLTTEVRDTKRLLEKSIAEATRNREEGANWQRKTRELEILHRDASGGQDKLERDFARFRQEREDELERTRVKAERTIAQLKDDLEKLREKFTAVEASESALNVKSKQLTQNLERMKEDMAAQKRDSDRNIEKIERQLALVDKNAADELARAREAAQKAEDRRKRDSEIAEGLAAQAKEQLERERAALKEGSVAKSSLQQAQERSAAAKVSEEQVSKLRNQLAESETSYEKTIRDLQQSLKEKERALRELADNHVSALSVIDKEHNADKKTWAERERVRGEEFEAVNEDLLAAKRAAAKLDMEKMTKEEEIADLQTDLADLKEDRKLDAEKAAAKLKALTEELRELQDEHHTWATEMRQAEQKWRQYEDEATSVARDLEDAKISLDEVTMALARTEKAYAEDKAESARKLEKALGDIARTEAELQTTTSQRDTLSKAKIALETRVAELEFYFMPVQVQEESVDLSGPAKKLLKKLHKERYRELEDIRKRHADTKAGNTVEELSGRFAKCLHSLPASNKDVVAAQLMGLLQALDAADYDITTRLRIGVVLAEGLVDPEIIRELRIWTEYMVEESLHFLDTPETVVLLTQRAVDEQKYLPDYDKKKRSELLNFRDLLLKRLTTMRAKRMGKTRKEVKKKIMDETYTTLED